MKRIEAIEYCLRNPGKEIRNRYLMCFDPDKGWKFRVDKSSAWQRDSFPVIFHDIDTDDCEIVEERPSTILTGLSSTGFNMEQQEAFFRVENRLRALEKKVK